MPAEHVTLGHEIPDDALRDVVSQVASGRVTPEQGWVNLQSRRAARPRPSFDDQFADLIPFLTATSHHGAQYPYDTAGMGWRRSAVIADDLHATGVTADLEAGLTPSPAGFRASGEVMGEAHTPGWDELAEVYLFHAGFFPVLTDPDLDAELGNYRSAVARGELRIAEYRRHERRLLDVDRE